MAWYDDQNAVVILPQANGATDASALADLADLKNCMRVKGLYFSS
jgi:hypothetical protein